ncbi:hypothetical protein [Sphingobium phenoxybenzoativorans]|uniref:hypothetical protein n=1 Tax=Sphingobium phenoxybenzoativorans TaxID=1592790 RepID=UPI0008723533|nr:hypothetical protein [Sphingobium phenoxybenzoativorans]
MDNIAEPQRAIDRLARYLGTTKPVDPYDWSGLLERASTIIAVLKDPDSEMVAAGNGDTWRAMIDAALVGKWDIAGAMDAAHHAQKGTDEEGEIELTPEAARNADQASWVNGKPE